MREPINWVIPVRIACNRSDARKIQEAIGEAIDNRVEDFPSLVMHEAKTPERETDKR